MLEKQYEEFVKWTQEGENAKLLGEDNMKKLDVLKSC